MAEAVEETKASEESPKAEAEEASKKEDGAPQEDKEQNNNVDTETLEAVKERLRFFFSDANVRQDTFLRKYLMEDSKTIPVEVLLRFNTIKKYTERKDVVLRAAKELDSILTVADGESIGRVDPFTEEKMNENIPVTLYLSNLPYEKKRYKHTTDEVKKLFGDDAGVVLVKFRFASDHSNKKNNEDNDDDDDDLDLTKQGETKSPRQRRRTPIGACLVEFESVDALQKAAAHMLTSKDDGETVQPAHALHLGDHVLEVQLLKDYIESRKNRNAKKRKQSDLPVEGSAALGDDGKEEGEEPPKQFELDWKPGCVIKVEGFGADCDREAILGAVAQELDMTLDQLKADLKIYADFSRGQSDGAIRFAEPSDHIQSLCDKLNAGELFVAGQKVEKAVILSGDEEKQYWDAFIAFKTKQMQQRAEERSARRGHSKRGRRS